MTARLLSTALWDIRLQLRHGFYVAAAFVAGTLALGLSRLPSTTVDVSWLVGPLVASNLTLGTFYFVGGLLLLEKGEGTLDALVVTPLRATEYLASKVATLTLLALVENLVIVVSFYGAQLISGLLPMMLGIALASAQLVLFGFIAAARFDSINEYLAPSVLMSAIASLPVFTLLLRADHWLLYLHPLQGPLLLMQGAINGVEPWLWLHAIGYSVLWIVGLGYWAAKIFQRFVVARAGVR